MNNPAKGHRRDILSIGAMYALVAALIAIAVTALAAYSVLQDRQRYEDRAALAAVNVSRVLEAQFSEILSKIDLSLQMVDIYHREQLGRGGIDAERLEALMERLQSAQPELEFLRVHDAQGFPRYGRGIPRDNPVSFADREYFIQLRDNPAAALVISSPLQGRVTGKWGIAISRRLDAPDGSFAGMVSAILTTDSFRKALSRLELGAHGLATIRSMDMALVYAHPEPRDFDRRVGDRQVPEGLRKLIGSQAKEGRFDGSAFDGVERTANVLRVEGFPFYVTVGLASRDYLVDWWRNTALIAALAALVVAITSLATWRLYGNSRRLRDSEARWNFALEGSAQGVWDWDIAAGKVYYSPRFKRLLGHDDQGLGDSDKEWTERIHPDDRAGSQAATERHLRDRTPLYEAEYRMRHKDGGYIWTHSRGMVVEWAADGKPRRMIGTLADISARKAAERILADALGQSEERGKQVELLNVQLAQRAVDAETAMRAKDAFLRNVTHEFRTPMNHIMGGAELLAKSRLDDRQGKWVAMIRDAARSLLRLINETLDAARIGAGGLKLEEVEFSPATVLEEVRLMLALRAKDKGLELTVQDSPELPAVVLGDPARLAQALLNYVDNAIKFTERGSVTLAARTVGKGEQGVQVRFEVRDTGIGIAPDVREKLFSAFTQADSSTTRPYGGVGIGLSNARELARLMGGEAGVASEPGRGSTFWLTACFKPVPKRAAAPAFDRGAVLAVLADLEARLAREDVLAKSGLRASASMLEAAVGREALATLRREIDQLDFASALATLRRIRVEVDGAP